MRVIRETTDEQQARLLQRLLVAWGVGASVSLTVSTGMPGVTCFAVGLWQLSVEERDIDRASVALRGAGTSRTWFAKGSDNKR
jgi:hypothetical protein